MVADPVPFVDTQGMIVRAQAQKGQQGTQSTHPNAHTQAFSVLYFKQVIQILYFFRISFSPNAHAQHPPGNRKGFPGRLSFFYRIFGVSNVNGHFRPAQFPAPYFH